MKLDKFNFEYFKEYVNTYDPNKNAMNEPKMILLDMLYGIGKSLSEDYSMFSGFKKFKMDLIEFFSIKKNIEVIDQNEYYKLMCGGKETMGSTFEEIHLNWYKCFTYSLMKFSDYNEKTIKSIFYDFDMDNWKALHKENSQYSKYDKNDLIKKFYSECDYISDRNCYDRLFRTHWLFREAFMNELNQIRFPNLFKPKMKPTILKP